MPHEVRASIVIKLDDDTPKEWTSMLSTVAAQWAQFLANVEPLHGIAAFEVVETKAKPVNGARRAPRTGKPQSAVEMAEVS